MTLLSLAVAIGLLLPNLIALVLQEHWKTGTKTVVAFLIAVLAALAMTAQKHAFVSPVDWHLAWNVFLTALSGLVAGTWGSFANLWQQLGVTQWIEHVTTIPPRQQKAVEALLTDAGAAVAKMTPEQRAQFEQVLFNLEPGLNTITVPVSPATPPAPTTPTQIPQPSTAAAPDPTAGQDLNAAGTA